MMTSSCLDEVYQDRQQSVSTGAVKRSLEYADRRPAKTKN